MSAPARNTGGRSGGGSLRSHKASPGRPTPQGPAPAAGPGLPPTSSRARLPKPPQGRGELPIRGKRSPKSRQQLRPRRYDTSSSRQRLLELALTLAGERGYEALRISDITDPVGVQRQAFYAHFRDKRHCLCEAISPRLASIERLAAAASDEEVEWAAQIMSSVDEVLYERFQSADGTKGRLLAAMVELLRESQSFDAIRIGKLIRLARVPTGDFYRVFSGKRECFAAAYEVILRELLDELRAEDPAGISGESRTSVALFLQALGSALTSDPNRLRLLVVEAAHLPDQPNEEIAGAWRGSFGAALAELLGECEGVDPSDPALPLIAASLTETIRSAALSGAVEEMTERLLDAWEGLGITGGSSAPEKLAA